MPAPARPGPLPSKRRRAAGAAVALVISALAATGCASSTGNYSSADGQLVEERCTGCHTLRRIERAQKDAQGWRDTVSRMRERGARLSDAEAERVITFLASNASGS